MVLWILLLIVGINFKCYVIVYLIVIVMEVLDDDIL